MNTMARLIRISGLPFWMLVIPVHGTKIDKPTPMTRSALRVRCLSSVGLNEKILVFGCGV